MSEANTGRAIGWEDEIENDGTQWVLLPEGDYRFQVESFERAHHPGSGSFRHVLKQFCISESTRRRAVVPLRIICFCSPPWSGSSVSFSGLSAKSSTEKS